MNWWTAHLVSHFSQMKRDVRILISIPDFEVEQDEMSRANPPVDLTPDLWVSYPLKLFI